MEGGTLPAHVDIYKRLLEAEESLIIVCPEIFKEKEGAKPTNFYQEFFGSI